MILALQIPQPHIQSSAAILCNDYVAAELAYTNLGSLETSSNSTEKSYASTTTEITALGVTLPTESTSNATYGAGVRFSVDQKVGIRWATTVTRSCSVC